MDLTHIWTLFIRLIESDKRIEQLSRRTYSGFPFLYIQTKYSKDEMESLLRQAASAVMKGKRLQADIVYVRKQSDALVYRMRFYVPNEKLVCCGRGCRDCIRYRSSM
ncbi:hypothetical protein [Bacillus sp. FJAT-45037]|uniref:hypothetical protein n=1 Tax=Bacillus sp. FJAT-45037 TaxID=2011007 RepID=UPI000C24B530|nr:hypothetical protein [Bacillus sp. FJAT-45037]